MPRRRTTTSTRCITAPPSSASTRARSSRRRWSASRCSRCCCPRSPQHNQEGTLHFHYLLDVQRRRCCACRARFDEHVPQLAAALAGHGGGDAKAARFVDGFVRPFGRREAATPRFVDAVEAVGVAAGAGARAARARPRCWRTRCCSRWPRLLSLHLRTQPWRKRTRSRLRKGYERRSWRCCDAVEAASSPISSSPPASGGRWRRRSPASSLTPKAGRQRDPAKTLAGTEFREAQRDARAGDGARPQRHGRSSSGRGCRRPASSCSTGSRSWPGRRPTATSIPSGWWSSRAAARRRWYRHITPHYEDIFSFYTPDEFRVAQRAADRRAAGPAEAHRDLVVRSRDPRARAGQTRGLQGAEVLHPSQMYQLFDHFWLQRTPVTLVEAFSRVRADPAAAAVRRARAAARALRRGEVLRQRRAAADRREPRVRDRAIWPTWRSTSTSSCSTPAQQFDDHADFPPGLRGRLHSIEHLMTPENNLAVQTEVIRGARGVRRHLRRLLVPGAAVRRRTRWRSIRTRAASASITSRWPSACSRRCAAARSPRSICARPRSSASGSPAPTALDRGRPMNRWLSHRRQPAAVRGPSHARAPALAGQRRAVVRQGPAEEDAKRLARQPPAGRGVRDHLRQRRSKVRTAPCGDRCARRRAGKRT